MTTHAQFRAAAAAVAAACDMEIVQVDKYCMISGLAGYTGQVERLATVFIAAHDAPARRGPKGRDSLAARCWRHSPRADADEMARIRARLRRAGGVA